MSDALGPCLDHDAIAFEVQDLCHDLVWGLLRSQADARCVEEICGGLAVIEAVEPLLLRLPHLGPLGSRQFLPPDCVGVLVEVQLLEKQIQFVDQQLFCSSKVPLAEWSIEDVVIGK